MKGLFQTRRIRTSHRPRARRDRLGAAFVAAERLEPRLVLAGDVSRPALQQTTTISIDTANAGPAPIVFEQVTGADMLVVKTVAHGAVQKWDGDGSRWLDISTWPSSADPRYLLQFLAQRTFVAGDRLRWVPDGGAATAQVFDIVNWNADTPPVDPPVAPLPSAVSSITVSASSEPGSLEIDWAAPASGDVAGYTVRVRSEGFSQTIDVLETSATFTGLAPLKPYAIDVWASNESGDGPIETAFHTLLDIRTVGDRVTAWDIRRSLLPAEPTDAQGNLLTPLSTPWGDRLGFPGVSYEAIWAATPTSPAEVPSLSLPVSTLGTATGPLSGGRSVAMWVQATGPGILLSSTVQDTSGSSIELPYLWIDTDGNVNGGFYGSDAFDFNTGQTVLSYQSITGDTVIGSPLAITGQVPVIDNNWHHVALVADGETQSLYIDGLLQGTTKPLVVQQETGLVSTFYGNTITINLDETPEAGEAFTARVFQDDTFTFTLNSTGPLRAVTPLAVSASDVVTPGSSYTPVASATLLIPAAGTPQLEIVMADSVNTQNPLSAMLLYSNEGSRFQMAPSATNLVTTVSGYEVGSSIFPASVGAGLPQVNYPQPFIGAIDDLAVWETALPQASVQAAMTTPVSTAVNGVVLPSGATLTGIAPPSFALNFSEPAQVPGSSASSYTFTNVASQGDSTAVATSTLLTVGTPATIPASPFSDTPTASNYLPRLGNYQNYGIGLMSPLDSGSVRVNRATPFTAQVALARGDLLTFALNGGQPTTVAITVTDKFGEVLTETVSTGNPISLGAAHTGIFKVTLALPADSILASVPLTYSQLPGGVNSLQPLLSVYEQRVATYTSFQAAYADPTIPTINPTSNFHGVAPPLATGAADYFPLWTDTTYFPTSSTTPAGQAAYAEQLSAAYDALVTANNGLSFANLNFQAVAGSRSIAEQVAIDLATAYHAAFGEEPPQLPASATSFVPSASDSPPEAIYKFFSNVNQWRQQTNAALQLIASSIASITPQSAPYEIADLIGTNQAAFDSGQSDGVVSESSEEDLGSVAKESSISLGEKTAEKFADDSVKEAYNALGGAVGGFAVGMALDMFVGWEKMKREPESSTSSIYVSFVPIVEAMTEYDSLENLAQSISVNSDAFARRIETQLTSPAYLQSIYSNFGLLKALAGITGDGVVQLADSGHLDSAAAEFSGHQAWSAMVPAAFSWQQVKPNAFPAANIQNIDDAYDWHEPLEINSNNSSYPAAMATGDFNADGYPDLVLSNTGGSDTSRQNLLVLFAVPNLNGDGNSVGYTTGWQYTEVTESSGDFTKVIEFESDNETPTDVAAADFNNDGSDDIVVNFKKTSNAAIYLGSAEVSSTGSLTAPEYAGSLNLNGGTQPEQIVVADFNNDGWIDFAAACSDSNSIVVAMNTTGLNEDETFSGIGTSFDGGTDNTVGELRFITYNISLSGVAGNLATGDLNNDGYPDLAATTDSGIAFLLSEGTGSSWAGFSGEAYSTFPSDLSCTEIAIGDFDGDGAGDDIAFLGTSANNVSDDMVGNGNQSTKVTPLTVNMRGGNSPQAAGLWLSLGEPTDYDTPSVQMTPTLMAYGAIGQLESIPKALKYGLVADKVNEMSMTDGLAYNFFTTEGGSADATNYPTATSSSIAVVPDPLAAQQAFLESPAIWNKKKWNGEGTSFQLSFGELTSGPGYMDLVVSPSGMIAASTGQGKNVDSKRWYSEVSWSNNVLSNSMLSTFLPDSGEELEFVTNTGKLPSNYNRDEFVTAAIASMQSGTPVFMPYTEYGLPSKVASPNFFVGAVDAMVEKNGELVNGSGRSIVGWNLVDNNGNPMALETASMLFGLVAPATQQSERGVDEQLPAVLPQLWEPIDREVEFADPDRPLRAYNGMWYADTRSPNTAVTSLTNAFFLWGRGNTSYHPDGVLTENALDLFASSTDGAYTVTLGPIPEEPPALRIPAPTNPELLVSESGVATLSWNAPSVAVSTPILYSVRVFNRDTGALITVVDTTESQAVFSSLQSPETSYYTITARIAGASSVAGYAPWIQNNESLPQSVRDNVFVGVATEGVPFVGGGLSGSGLTYNHQALSGSLGYRGIDFALAASNTPNMIASTGETVSVNGTGADGSAYNAIYLSAAAVGRDLEDVEIIVTTTDNIEYTWTQSFSDWKDPSGFAGETIVASMPTAVANSGVAIPFQTESDGSVTDGQYSLYGYSWLVPAGKTVASITLPDQPFLNVLDIVLTHVEQVQISSTDWSEWNAFGITSGAKQVPNSQGFNGEGQYYDGDSLSSPLQYLTNSGNTIEIALGNINNDGATVDNFVSAQGQRIQLSTGSENITGMSLAAAFTGERSDTSTPTVTIQVGFSDGTNDNWDLTLYPWIYQNQGSPPEGHPPLLSSIEGYRRQDGNFSNNGYTYIYGYQYLNPTGKQIVSLTLPDNSALGILGLTIEKSTASGTNLLVNPPSAPQDLTAVAGPASGQMTLAWQAPVSDYGDPVTSYTATVVQGGFSQTITTADQSCVFVGPTLGSGPMYFTVTASSFAGVSSAATLQIDSAGNTIPPQPYTGIGITTDGVQATSGGFDGAGNTYSWTALGDTASGGALTGSTLVSGGLTIEISPNQPDFTWAAGQTIDVTRSGSVLTLAAAAVNGSQTGQTLTLTFTDGSSTTWTQSFSDWCDPQYYDNELILSTQSYRNTAAGETDATTNYIYSYGFTLPDGKTLESITLPNNPDVQLLGLQLSSPTPVDLSGDYNFWGIANGQTQAANNEGFDRNGHYYYSGDLPSSVTYESATFNFGPTSTSKHGTNNFVQAQGQSIDLPEASFGWLYLAAAAANGSQTNQVMTLHFSDGTTATWTQSFSDWCDYEEFDGQTVISTQDNWVDQVGNVKSQTNRVYGYAYKIQAGKTLQSITLPNNDNIGVLGITLV